MKPRHISGAAAALAFCGIVVAAAPALAQSRPSTLRMSCTAANRLVSARGAIVLSTGRDLYDRYVANRSFCLPDETTKPAFVPAGDNPQCFIGYYCERVDDEFDRF